MHYAFDNSCHVVGSADADLNVEAFFANAMPPLFALQAKRINRFIRPPWLVVETIWVPPPIPIIEQCIRVGQ